MQEAMGRREFLAASLMETGYRGFISY